MDMDGMNVNNVNLKDVNLHGEGSDMTCTYIYAEPCEIDLKEEFFLGHDPVLVPTAATVPDFLTVDR